jgi:hypothetical protein
MSTYDERTFEEALRIQAVGAGGPRLTLDDVRGRARRIRRTRTAVATTGAAGLVAAAVLPLALLVGGEDSADTLPPVSTPTVSDTANPVEPDPEPGEAVSQAGSWLLDGQVHPAEGAPFTPDVEGDVVSFAGLGDGRWVFSGGPGGGAATITVTDGAGAQLAAYDAQDTYLATDDVTTAVSWIGPGGDPQVLLAGVEEPIATGAELDTRLSPPTPLEILPGCSQEECYVLVETYDDSPEGSTRSAVGLDGSVQDLDRLGLRSITDVSQDGALVSGITSVDELGQEYCSGVVNFATGEQLWETCDAGTLRFSPDGTVVLGIDANLDGANHSFVQVLDARRGEPVRTKLQGTVFDEAWIDDEHYLVSLGNPDGENALFRFSLANEPAEQVADAVAPEFEGEPAYRITR